MAGPPTAQEAQVTCVFSGVASPTGAVATIGVQAPGEFPSNVLDVLGPLFADFHVEIAVNSCILDHIELKVGPTSTGPTYTKAINQEGSATGSATPPNVAVLIRKELTGVSGRYAGRMFWPAMLETKVGADGLIDPSHLGSFQLAANELLQGLATAGYPAAVFGGTDALVSHVTLIQRLSVQSRVATQRRRLRR